MSLQYERDPETIYRNSFATIRAEVSLNDLAPDLHPLAIRLIHACGMVDLIDDFEATDDVVACARAALEIGAPILCGCEYGRIGHHPSPPARQRGSVHARR